MSEQTASSYPLEDGDGNIIYPPTLTSVVFDENSKRLDTVLANIPRLGKIDPEPVDTIPRDADTLGGHAPDYFATNDSLISFYDVSQRENIQLDSAWVTGTRTITYTATKDCITGGRLSLNGINISTDIKINNYLISRCYQMMSANSIVDYPVNIPLKKGQTLTITITANNSSDKSFLSFLAYGMLK